MFIGNLYQEWTHEDDGGDSHSEQDYDFSNGFSSDGGGLSVSEGTSCGGMGLSFGSGLGSSMDLARSLSATMTDAVPVRSVSPGPGGAGTSPGFTYTIAAKRQKRSGSFGSLPVVPGLPGR